MTRNYGLEAQQAAETHLAFLELATYENDEEFPALVDVTVESAGPYCGCTTCVVREVLYAAWPILLEAARAEVAQ